MVMLITPLWLLWYHPLLRVTVVDPLNRGLNRVSEWCDLRGMRLNASNSKTMMELIEISCGQNVQCFWAGRFYEQGQFFFVDFSSSLPFCLPLFSLSLPIVYGPTLVICGVSVKHRFIYVPPRSTV